MKLLFLLLVASQAIFGATFESIAKSKEPHIKFNYPDAEWEVLPPRVEKEAAQQVDKSMAQQTLVVIQRKQADEKYHARFHVVTDSLEKFNDPKVPVIVQYQKHVVDFLKNQRCMILSNEPIQLPNVKENAFEVTANQRDFGLKFKQVAFVHEGKAYILTATARTEKFDSYKNDIKTIFDSFQFVEAGKK